MEQIIIYDKSEDVKYDLQSERPVRSVVSAKLQRQHMANDYVQMQVVTSEIMNLEIGDYIEVHGCRYAIRTVSDVVRSGEDEYTYTITFYGVMYDLMRYKFRNTSTNGVSATDSFDLTYSLKEFIAVLINNVERCNDKTWAFDETGCPDTEPITMSFDKQNLLTALQNITTEFDVEFRISQEDKDGVWMKTLHVGTFGDVVNSTPFEYGMGNGLYQLQEGKVDDSCIINRLWVEGGTDNILSGYRGYSSRLQLPMRRQSSKEHTITVDGEDITFPAGVWIGIEDDENRYVDEEVLATLSTQSGGTAIDPYKSTDLIDRYGIIEDSVTFDDVIPTRTFEVKSITNTNGRVLTCDVDFDLTAKWLLNYEDFNEWCRLKTSIEPTEAEYNACVDFEMDQSNVTSWNDYRVEIGTNNTTDPYRQWYYEHHSAYPYQPDDYKQEVYEQYCIYKDVVDGNNSKYLIDGGQLAFIDGKLAGLTFDIGETYSYNESTGISTITIIQKEDETETVYPSEDEFGAFRIAVGDHFKLVNIYMPYSYYEDAEEELWFKAYEKFESVKYASYLYKLTFDKIFVEDNDTLFASILPGDYITITDSRFGISAKRMRVTQVDCDLTTEYDYTITLESVHKLSTRYGYVMQKNDTDVIQALKEMGLDDPLYRRNNRVSGATALHRILDGNGYLRDVRVSDLFIAERMIKPNAITTAKLGLQAVAENNIKDSAVTHDKIKDKAIKADLIDDNAVTKDHISHGIILYDNDGNTAIDLGNKYIVQDLQLYDMKEGKVREYTLLQDAQNGRDIRKFITGKETGDLKILDDDGNSVDLVSFLGADKEASTGMRVILAAKADANNVPTITQFNTLNKKVGDESTSGTLLYRTQQLEENKAESSKVPTIDEVNTRFDNLQTIRTMLSVIYEEMTDWNTRIEEWTSSMQKNYPETKDFPLSKTTCAHANKDAEVCMTIPQIDKIERSVS